MPKLDLTTARRIKVAGGEALALKGQGFAWAKAPVDHDANMLALGIPHGAAEDLTLADGDPVAQWDDRAGIWESWSQLSTSQNPIYRHPAGGVPYVEFDSVLNNVLRGAGNSSYFEGAPAVMMMLAARAISHGGYALMLPTASAVTSFMAGIRGYQNEIAVAFRRVSSDSLISKSASADRSVDHVALVVVDHTDQSYALRYNGSEIDYGPTGLTAGVVTNIGDVAGLGGSPRASSNSAGQRIYAWALANRVLTPAEISTVEAWAASKLAP